MSFSEQHPRVLIQTGVKFLYEQDGIPERELKQLLCDMFAKEAGVQRAYLARVGYDDPEPYIVALCLNVVPETDEPLLAKAVSRIFSSMFGTGQHLDIIFLSEEQEGQLMAVCRPFFERG